MVDSWDALEVVAEIAEEERMGSTPRGFERAMGPQRERRAPANRPAAAAARPPGGGAGGRDDPHRVHRLRRARGGGARAERRAPRGRRGGRGGPHAVLRRERRAGGGQGDARLERQPGGGLRHPEARRRDLSLRARRRGDSCARGEGHAAGGLRAPPPHPAQPHRHPPAPRRAPRGARRPRAPGRVARRARPAALRLHLPGASDRRAAPARRGPREPVGLGASDRDLGRSYQEALAPAHALFGGEYGDRVRTSRSPASERGLRRLHVRKHRRKRHLVSHERGIAPACGASRRDGAGALAWLRERDSGIAAVEARIGSPARAPGGGEASRRGKRAKPSWQKLPPERRRGPGAGRRGGDGGRGGAGWREVGRPCHQRATRRRLRTKPVRGGHGYPRRRAKSACGGGLEGMVGRVHAASWFKRLAEVVGGGGGGRPTSPRPGSSPGEAPERGRVPTRSAACRAISACKVGALIPQLDPF